MSHNDNDFGLPERFWTKVNKNGPVVREELGPCWLWMGSRLHNGYGRFSIGSGSKRWHYVHRLALAAKLRRTIRPGLCSLHKCDVRHCVRPKHLFEGTLVDNTSDMVKKRRQAVGEMRALKLSNRKVRAIRNSSERQSVLAERHGISQSLVSRLQNRKRWQHVA